MFTNNFMKGHFSQILHVNFGNFHRFCSKSKARNPYDVLGLKTTCSTKDVKKAYIKLCKELHPDMKPGDVSQHKKFIELNDAYITLLNSGKRSSINKESYRNQNVSWKSSHQRENNSHTHWHSEKAWYDRKEYQEYYRQRKEENVINKKLRIANSWIITGCITLMILGSSLYLSAYRYATNYTLEKVDEKSRRLSESYIGIRKHVINKEKIEHLKKKWSE